MFNCRLPILCLFGLCLFGGQASGQAARSPFSSFGLGERYGTALVQQQSMGGVGVSNPEYWYINNVNPALLIYNRVTTFQFGMIGESRTQTTGTNTERSGSGNLGYLALAIPLKQMKWTSSVALMPYTRLNYSFTHLDSIAGSTTNTVNVKESGTGGIDQVAWSNGVAITKRLSLGLKAAYLFSSTNTEYSTQLTNTSQQVIIYPNIKERTYVSDFQFSPAASIHFDSLFRGKKYKLSAGIVWDIQANLNAKFSQQIQRRTVTSLIDTLTVISNAPGTITVPNAFTGGITFGKGLQWAATIEGAYSDYNQYKDLTGAHPYHDISWRLAGGFQITPDPTSLGAYLKRLTYRTGVSLENYPYLVNGHTFKDFGITFGFSMPVSRISTLDFGLKTGKRGDKSLNGIEENYLKIYFGITFNDQWFIKRRFD